MLTKCSQMLTHVIDAPLPEPNSTIVLYYYSKDFPSVINFSTKTEKIDVLRNSIIKNSILLKIRFFFKLNSENWFSRNFKGNFRFQFC